jgi:hypothetical protein
LAFAEEEADWRAAWGGLFVRTYGAELRVEGTARAARILDANPRHFEELHRLLIRGARPASGAECEAAATGWTWRRRAGKALNVLRLAKAAFTFRGGIAYALDKVERHSGRSVELSSWQRRWPWLAAPVVFLRLLWERRLR